VVPGCEQKSYTELLDAARYLFRREIEVHTGGFQHVALPDLLDTDRLPCLHAPPAAATTMALAVEILNVPAESPPVPQVSTRCSPCTGTCVASSRITPAAAAISSTFHPSFAGDQKPAICAGVACRHDQAHHIAHLLRRKIATLGHRLYRCLHVHHVIHSKILNAKTQRTQRREGSLG